MAYKNYVSSLAGENQVSKRLWTFIKSQRKDYCSVPPIEFEGNTYSDHFDKAEALNNYFCSVFTTGSRDNHPSVEGVPFPCILPINISFNGVQQLLRKRGIVSGACRIGRWCQA